MRLEIMMGDKEQADMGVVHRNEGHKEVVTVVIVNANGRSVADLCMPVDLWRECLKTVEAAVASFNSTLKPIQ